MSKIVSQLNKEGVFLSAVEADESPLEAGVWLVPGGAVDFPPPVVPEGKRAKWDGAAFVLEDPPVPPAPEPPQPPTPQEIQEQKNREARAYLASTDWYVTRFAETGQAIPDDIRAAREAARASVVE